MSAINVGSRLDQGVVYWMNNEGQHTFMNLSDITHGKRVVLFGGPAPFSRLDTEQAKQYAELAKDMMQYVNMVYGIYLQDAFVCREFQHKVREETGTNIVVMLADGDGLIAKNYELTQDLTHQGLGLRSVRWSAVVNDGAVEFFATEDNSSTVETHPEEILDYLRQNG
jgi:peroxiredoxin